MEVADSQKQLSKKSLLDMLDPKIRSIIDKKKSLGSWQEKAEVNPEHDELDSRQNKDKIILNKGNLSQKLKTHDVEDFGTGSIQAQNESVRNYFYLDRKLFSSHLIKQLDSHAVTLTRLRAMCLKPKSLKRQESDMKVHLIKKIIELKEFKRKNEADAKTAKKINIEANLDAEVFFRCMKKKVYMTK